MNSIDINSDLGESFGQWHMGDDARMLTVVSSANIACGFHAGDRPGCGPHSKPPQPTRCVVALMWVTRIYRALAAGK